MQLVAYGAQDIYITGNPQITFFKVVYRRHTNFAIETIEHPFVGTVGFNNKVSVKISRNGDLITRMYLRVILGSVDPTKTNSKFAWTRRVGHAIIKQVDIEIGGSKIDRQYGTWLDIWYELARQGDHEYGYANMIGDIPILTNYDTTIKPSHVLYIPLQFWFNRFVGLAVPLIALQYHETVLNLEFENVNNLIIRDCKFDTSNVTMTDASILVNYVYLDTDERRRFALVGHEYLIDQLQFNGIEPVVSNETKYTLDFNHPTKEIIWAVRNGNFSSGKSFVYYSNADKWSMVDASCIIIEKSISIGIDPRITSSGDWQEVTPNKIVTVGTFNITNKSPDKSVFVNPDSLRIGDYGITNKINADIIINEDSTLTCNNVVTSLTIRDLSIPVEYITDTRYNVCDPIINIFSNYGIMIDGSVNPVQYGLLQFNGHDRFDRREGAFFNYVQPIQHHRNTPKDGINCYSFSLYPEEHQPSGTSNMSRIETSQLTLWFSDPTYSSAIPDLHYFNDNNKLFIYAVNYNILRIFSGLAGLSYAS